MSVPPETAEYDWILAITTIAFVFASASNGANDVANSYATSVAAKTLTMVQAGILATITEFVGAVALGARVTSTIKNGIITIDRFEGRPAVLMLAMGCAEVGNAFWLTTATTLGMPVSVSSSCPHMHLTVIPNILSRLPKRLSARSSVLALPPSRPSLGAGRTEVSLRLLPPGESRLLSLLDFPPLSLVSLSTAY